MVCICLGFLALLSLTTTAAHPFAFPFKSSLRVLDIRFCSFDLAPLASCRDLRRLYTSTANLLDLTPMQGLMPILEIKSGNRDEFSDARDL
jgi:hypothetical protein